MSGKPALTAGRWHTPRNLLDVCSNTNPVAHLVIQTDEGDVHFYQPLKQGHLKVEVLGQVIHVSTGAQLGRETWLRVVCWDTLITPQRAIQAPAVERWCTSLGNDRLRINRVL